MADEFCGSPADPDWVIDEDVARQPGHTFISAKRHGIPAKGANTQRYANQDVARYSGRSLTSEKRHGIPAKAMEPKIKVRLMKLYF